MAAVIRRGRRNPHTLYWQSGPEPDHDADRFVGVMFSPELAALAVVGLNRLLGLTPGGGPRRPDWPTGDDICREVEQFLNDKGDTHG